MPPAEAAPARVSDTRARLVTAAETLFAERGIDAVSLREVTRASGAKNAVAVQYHFSDRAGVVLAILDKHAPDVESRRGAMLDDYESRGEPDLRFLAAAFVRPLAAQLANADGGPQYLQIYADLLNRPKPECFLADGLTRLNGFDQAGPTVIKTARKTRNLFIGHPPSPDPGKID